jgi:hypothetical protein
MPASAKSTARKPRAAKKAATAPRVAGSFNSSGLDLTGTTPRPAGRFEYAACHTDGCGDEVQAGQKGPRPAGSVVLTVFGRIKASWFCSTSCASRDMALADVRSLR